MTTAYTAVNNVPFAALPNINGVVQNFSASTTNVADATFAPDGLSAAPIFGLGGQQLQGNEIVAGGIATVVSYIGPLLNSGALCWVLLESDGGTQQVANATASLHAINRGLGDQRYAALAGLATQLFSVADATGPKNAVNRDFGDQRYAALAGLATQLFSVADAVNPKNAVNLGQFPATLAIPGAANFPGGLKLKWGQTGPILSGGFEDVTFATPFPNGLLAVFGSQISGAALAPSSIGSFATANQSAHGVTIWSYTGVDAGSSTWYWL